MVLHWWGPITIVSAMSADVDLVGPCAPTLRATRTGTCHWWSACHSPGERAFPMRLLCAGLNSIQGSRAHWSSENTAMHVVRSVNGSIFIDEHDLVSMFYLLTFLHSSCSYRTSPAFAQPSATASRSWTRFTSGTVAAVFQPSVKPPWRMPAPSVRGPILWSSPRVRTTTTKCSG